MMHQYTLRLLVLLQLVSVSLLAQKRPPSARARTPYETFAMRNRMANADPIICYSSKENAFTRVGPPAGFNDARARRAPTAKIEFDYVAPFPDSVKAAFRRAGDIWASLITSPVTIRIQATWRPLADGVLGSARPASYRGAPNGSQRGQAFYPIALAEKIARRDLNPPNEPDLVANFSSTNNWYLGLDANPFAGRYDLVTVVLHELGHGLGFTGGIRGIAEDKLAAVQIPTVFDTYIENNLGTRLLSPSVANDPTDLFTQLTGRNLFLNGPILQQKTGDRAKLHAPATYSPGSSLYHLDEATYRTGTANALMTPFIAQAEVAQNPGPSVMAFFEDIEWKTTSLLHEPVNDTETAVPAQLVAQVISDTTLGAAPPTIFYRRGFPTASDNAYKSVPMVRQGTTQTYTYTFPAAEAQGTIAYFIQTQDGTGRAYTNPGKSNDGTGQFFHAFTTGADRVPPRIVHSPKRAVLLEAEVDSSALEVLAVVTDDRRILTSSGKIGVDTVFVEYQVNGQARPPVPMRLQNSLDLPDSTWRAVLPLSFASLRAGTVITYRIVARDVASGRNQAVNPATGFYTITVIAPQTTVRSQYINNFDGANAAADFVGNGFRIEQPASFSSASINTDHPYKDGADANNQSNFTYLLLAPIKLKTNPDSARISYDEVVLVEPGEPGSTYLEPESFYDYVIVEGSKDNGRTWRPLIDGYDSNSRPEWLAAWKANTSPPGPFSETNSLTPGTPSLVRNRTFGLTSSGFFRPDDTIIIRFRLFTDQLSHGWGWLIDNLQIQVPPPPVVLAVEPMPLVSFQVYPNPSANLVRVTAELTQPANEGTLTLSGPSGQTLRQVTVAVRGGTKIVEQLDISQLPAGMYFLQLNAGDARQVRKIMVTR